MTGAAATSFPAFAAAAVAEKNHVIVSVHDVAPETRTASEKIIDKARQCGVQVCSLLVVPDYHHQGAAWEKPTFMEWLRELEGAGHEIVIHGYFHQRPRKNDETFRARFLTRCYTEDEGEFYDLNYAEAFRRITEARDEFLAAGLRPRGFVAPAWLLSADAERAATDAEMEYTTRLTTVVDLRTREVFRARSLVYSVRSAWRRAASLGWNAALSRLQSSHSLVRLGIHPVDVSHPRIWKHIARLLKNLSDSRTPTTYRDWIAERRASRADQNG